MEEKSFKSKIMGLLQYWPILAIIIVGLYFYLNKTNSKEKTVSPTPEISIDEVNANNLAHKYNALINWSNDVNSTIQFQEKITGKIALFKGSIDDIYLKNGKSYIRLNSYYLENTNYILQLECEKKLVDKIRNRSNSKDSTNGIGDDYGVIGILDDISKSTVRIESEFDGDESEGYIDIDSPDLFIGNGKCIDVIYLGRAL